MSIRLMHLADLHLGAPLSYLGDKAEERARELESALVRALSAAAAKKVDAILISGDLFDRFNPPLDLVARVKNAFAKLSRENIPVLLIPGTHDSHRYARCIYHRERFPGVDVLMETGKPVQKQINGHTIYFYGFSGSDSPVSPSSLFCRTPADGMHVALVHGTVAENDRWESSPRDFSVTPADIGNSSFDYVALGHHHNFKQFKRGKTTALYPGTLEGLTFGESGDRFLVIVALDENGVSVEKLKHNRRALKEIEIDLSQSGLDCGESLERAIARFFDGESIASVSLTGSIDFLPSPKELEARLAGGFFHLQITDNTSIYDSAVMRSIAHDRTVRGIFARKMLKKIEIANVEEKPALELALRLTLQQFQQVHYENQRALD
ncbi:MAG: exonuclease SbcCD subunit D [Candidatus Abyssobacteria bacterium SURF_5]|uniref:Exonuclease SbcCD subunit D n=1 Tax=Abyssobacteria bacterium (strain SURF_5) TaxID=2093360 RepID=A0A3A4P3B2_ABYX5|nr:MAG: exonuclease SbcCD subunit D [Candidatus Abyssubacteria bacterium SURF_5]